MKAADLATLTLANVDAWLKTNDLVLEVRVSSRRYYCFLKMNHGGTPIAAGNGDTVEEAVSRAIDCYDEAIEAKIAAYGPPDLPDSSERS